MHLAYDQLPDPEGKFELGEIIGNGVNSKVYKATELCNERTVAIKIQAYDSEHQEHIEEEYRILRDYSNFPNIPDFYGVYKQKSNSGGPDDVWFVLEYCGGGTAVEMVNKLILQGRTMREEHIAFLIRQTVRAALELNRNHFLHRDIRGSNILLTKSGEVKLCDFGLTREVDSTLGKRGTCIGSPCWMAPEVVTAQEKREKEVYTSRADVWAIGITAIELADGKPPFFDMHPSRVLFQIVRNPPPTLYKPTSWSQGFNDFIAECLEKNPENRPMMMEIVEHPFLTELFDNETTMQQEIKQLVKIANDSPAYEAPEEMSIERGYIRRYEKKPEKMYSEDLAAINDPSEATVIDFLQNRMGNGSSYSFVGDILLSVNSNDIQTEYDDAYHARYKNKSRSENAPHIFVVADIAYQDMLHHKDPQHVIFSGESYSGKTTNVNMFIDQICFLGAGNKGATDRVKNSVKVLQMLVNAGTPLNNNSTRCAMQYYLTFGTTGKMSGAVFNINMLEKTRVSTTDMNQHNFHIFYYFYDFMSDNGKLDEYHLDHDRSYRYLRIPAETPTSKLTYCRDNTSGNADKFNRFEDILKELDISVKNIETIRKMLAAILTIGNIRFTQSEKKTAEIENREEVSRISELMRIDEKKFTWSLINYCKIKGGIAERKQYTAEEARDARDSLAATMYQRLVDWIVNKINMNLAFPRAVFGDANTIIVYDMFGFECFHRNGFEQLMVNTLNEQMQYHYNQKIFVNEMMEQEADGLPGITLNYFDNRTSLDHLLTKPDGMFCLVDDCTRINYDPTTILDHVSEKKSQFVKMHSNTEISVSHFTGKIVYDIRSFIDLNKDFVPPEMIESLRTSLDETIVLMFTNQLTKSGNLTMAFENVEHKKADGKRRTYSLNTLSVGHVSQVNNLRTLSANFRHTCLELLKTLSKGFGYGTHFIRCIRADLDFIPRNFHPEMVSQQIKALGVLDTIIARQKGYSCRISFSEFLRRYQFLAFDFDETVDITKDNCRLLLVRLKMEGWAIGKSKVFLRYFNDEFLARLYEIQVKKVIKVQSMMRAMLSRRKLKKGGAAAAAAAKGSGGGGQSTREQDEAAVTIQKAFRGFQVRQKYGPLLNEKTGNIDATTAKFVKDFARKWKRKTIFQVLLLYRAARYQDLVNLSQQVHIYNQRVAAIQMQLARGIPLEKVNSRENNPGIFGPMPIPAKKLPFRLDEIPYYDTSYMCDPVNSLSRQAGMHNLIIPEEEEPWDAPLKRNPSLTTHLMSYNAYKKEQACQTNWDKIHDTDNIHNQTFSRDPKIMRRLSQRNNFRNEFNHHGEFGHRNDFSHQDDYINRMDDDFHDVRRSQSNNQNAYNNNGYNQKQSPTQTSHQFRSGSRRNSLKNYAAPPPPPMMNMNRDDAARTRMGGNRTQNFNVYTNRSSATNSNPSNPVEEMQRFTRNSNIDNDDGEEEAPFNFKSMLRKTNYSQSNERNTQYDSRQQPYNNENDENNMFMSKLRPTGRKLDEYQSGNQRYDENRNQSNQYQYKFGPNQGSQNQNFQTTSSLVPTQSRYIDEELSPGVTISGYAIDI